MMIPENWANPQNILVILAHPDDPEFFCGATLARWAADGHHISYCLLTCGDKGVKDRHAAPPDLCAIRQVEQSQAAAILGVEKVEFLSYADGYIVPDLVLRRDIVRAIRRARPDIVVTSDPTNLFVGDSYLNHPDHRYAGQAVLDAVFPAAGNHLFFEDLLFDEGLEPHGPREVWVTLTSQPTITLDVTPFWETKIRALYEHVSQIGDRERFTERMRSRHTPESTIDAPRYEEKFRRILFG
ncbi:MAG: PIG-L deacetylase family protein [Chloroflexota bacterium]